MQSGNEDRANDIPHQTDLIYAVPLMIVALGAACSERSGYQPGAGRYHDLWRLIGVLVRAGLQTERSRPQAPATGSPRLLLAMLVAAAFGAVFSLLLAFAAINLRADQTIGGTALNLLAPAWCCSSSASSPTRTRACHGRSASWFMIKKTTLGFDRTAEPQLLEQLDLQVFLPDDYVCIVLFISLHHAVQDPLRSASARLRRKSPGGGFAGHQRLQDALCRCAISGALAGMGGFVYAVTTANCASTATWRASASWRWPL